MREIRGAVIKAAGRPTSIETLRLDDPRPGEVLVRMTASGVCHSDLHVRDGDWVRPGPIVLGHEGAGVVEAVGHGVDPGASGARWRSAGTRRACAAANASAGGSGCASAPRRCATRQADGTTRLAARGRHAGARLPSIGTFAEAQVVPASAVVPMPDGVPPEVAALIGCGVSTGVGAVVKTAEVPAGSTVAVIGLGGVGLSCVMGAVLAGARRIVAVDVNRAKLDLAGELGATHWVHADPSDPRRTVEGIRTAAGDGGPDFVFEAIGAPETIAQAIAALPPGGTAVLVGLTRFGEAASVRGVPVRGRRPADPGLELRVRGRGGRLPALCRGLPRRAGCRSTARSTGGSRSTTSRTPSTGSGPGRRRARW